MAYEAKDFGHLIGLEGFSDNALNTHFKLYQGYVKNTNTVADLVKKYANEGKAGTPEFAELNRRFGWEFDGMRLHEYYFGAMQKGGVSLDEGTELFKRLSVQFGSFANWEKEFRGVAGARGIGWGILYYDKKGDRLLNFWIDQHDKGHPAGCVPLLPIDVFEHAFMLDYGTDKGKYVDAFFKAINWGEVNKRLEKALTQ